MTSKSLARVTVALLAAGLVAQVLMQRADADVSSESRRAAIARLDSGIPLPASRLAVLASLHERNAVRTAAPSAAASDVFGTGCHLLIFFHSNCEYCRSMAPKWAGIDSLLLGAHPAAVSWISVTPADTGALAYLQRYSLAGSSFGFTSRSESRSFGVMGWPMVVLVAEGRIVVPEGEWAPRDLQQAGHACP